MGCWKKFWPMVIGCVLRPAGSSIKSVSASNEAISILHPLNFCNLMKMLFHTVICRCDSVFNIFNFLQVDSLSKKLSVLQKSITTKDTEIIELEQKLEDANRSVLNLQRAVWFIYTEILATTKTAYKLIYEVAIVLYRVEGSWSVDFWSFFSTTKIWF